MENSGKKRYLCKCQSHCTTYNPLTGHWEGGRSVSRSLRGLHHKDDRTAQCSKQSRMRTLLDAKVQQTTPGASITAHAKHNDYLALIRIELDLLAAYPVTSPLRPLSFNRDPRSSDPNVYGSFWWPTLEEMIQPNTGRYTLKEKARCNILYLDAEFRLCEIYKYLSTITYTDIVLDLQDSVRLELERLNEQKAFQWSQQITHSRYPNSVVNTGIIIILLIPA